MYVIAGGGGAGGGPVQLVIAGSGKERTGVTACTTDRIDFMQIKGKVYKAKSWR